MKAVFWLICLLSVLTSGAHASAASVTCIDVFKSEPHVSLKEPIDVLNSLYDQAQFLGIAVNDHEGFEPFSRLYQLLQQRGLDPNLKTIVIEDSSMRAELYQEASVKEISSSEFRRRAIELFSVYSDQNAYINAHIIYLIREINKKRPNDPLILVPIDGMNNAAIEELTSHAPSVDRTHSKSIKQNAYSGLYATSITRERDTARNFSEMVYKVYPGRKSVIIYQASHILKNVNAVGVDLVGKERVAKKAHLSWLSIAQKHLGLDENVIKIVVFDTIGSWSPNGLLNLPSELSRPHTKAVAFYASSPDLNAQVEVFKDDTFIRRYRNRSLSLDKINGPMFDAVVLELSPLKRAGD